jgi:phage gpG-like protein
MPVTINKKDLAAIARKLESLDDPKVFRRPMTQSVQHLQRKLAKQPPKAAGAFSAMATPGQRRAYWAKVSAGDITHGSGGYRRSGILRQGWTTEVTNGGRRGVVGTNVPYAVYVQGPQQQPFHAASNYPTTEKVAEEEADTVVGFFEKEYERQLRK